MNEDERNIMLNQIELKMLAAEQAQDKLERFRIKVLNEIDGHMKQVLKLAELLLTRDLLPKMQLTKSRDLFLLFSVQFGDESTEDFKIFRDVQGLLENFDLYSVLFMNETLSVSVEEIPDIAGVVILEFVSVGIMNEFVKMFNLMVAKGKK